MNRVGNCKICQHKLATGLVSLCEPCRRAVRWIGEALAGEVHEEPFPGFRDALVRHHAERVERRAAR